MSAITRAALAAAAAGLAACTSSYTDVPQDLTVPGSPNQRPSYIRGTIDAKTYDGSADDLLTAGLGRAGLAGAAPAVANAASPTVAELRRVAIYNNYRALVDVAANGGYGSLYGPNVSAAGVAGTGDGKIAGEEIIAYADDGSGRQNVTLMVQIPTTFSTSSPCIIAAPSSGSRGVYGAIGTAGEWGLKRGCAVAYTDKGTGNGGHDLAANAVNLMLGQRSDATAAGLNSQFTSSGTAAELAAFNGAFPNRWAFKHAHSQQNPEATWGRDTLRSIEFAFYMINERFGAGPANERLRSFVPSNTLVIASSVSNGGGASIAAAEQDTQGLIDGVAVAEPQIVLNAPAGVTIRRGTTAVPSHSRALYDYFTIGNLYQPCASLAPAVVANTAGIVGVTTPAAATATNRCAALAARGLVTGATTTEQANDALARLIAAGWEADSIPFQASHYSLATLSVTLTYGNAFARANVRDNLCGYSFGATPVNGVPPALAPAAAAQIFGTGNGVPPTSGVNIINNNATGGAAVDAASVTAGSANFNTEGAVCLRELYTGTGTAATAVRSNIDAIKRTGNLRGKAAVIVHGRADTLVPVNHTSRPYYALNKQADANSRLAYYEVTNGQHFDAFIDNAAAPGYDTRAIPLHVYFNRAMDIVWNNLRSSTAIPPSQVVRTTPRGGTPGAAPAITPANVPPIAATPAAGDAITFASNTLTIPD